MPRIKSVLKHLKPWLENVKAIETTLFSLALWWAFILALPTDTFGSSITYNAMARFASEGVWATAFFTVAFMTLFGMIFERFYIRMVGLIASAGLWIFVAAMMAVSNIATTGTGVYFIVFCLTTYVIYKVGEQRGH